ncbi:MAG: hypothetical protein ACJAYY_000345 [Paraglaciecola sp.]|jgi:hypothetical protein
MTSLFKNKTIGKAIFQEQFGIFKIGECKMF